MKITENEMRGLIRGQCLPGDIMFGESLAAYLVRKFDEQRKKLDALAAEAAYLRDEIKRHSESVHFCELCGKDDPCITDDVCRALNHELPATDAYLNSVRAEGVEMYGDATIAIGKEEGDEAIVYAGKQALLFAAQLRAGKDGE